MQPPKEMYFIALVPGEELCQRIKEMKREMQERFQACHALKSPAHITLQKPFKREGTNEAMICQKLALFASREQSFPVTLSGFGYFKPKVLYVNIADPKPIVELYTRLIPFLLDEVGIFKEETSNVIHPHLTIASRDLTEVNFYKAWNEYADKPFEATFEATFISLLKHNGSEWTVMDRFAFRAVE